MIEKIKKLNDLIVKYPHIHLPKFTYPAENPLFIDIETTGFSPQNAMIYAIGCIYRQQNEYYFHQLFADGYYEENNVLIALEKIIQVNQSDLLIHFNGKNFDIPFLKGRYLNNCLFTSLGDIPQFDFYLEWKKCRSYFELPNTKLKTLEKVLHLNRSDQMDGGKLITVYQRYLDGEKDLLPLLLLHNEEDLLATFLLGHFMPFLDEQHLSHFLFPYFDAFGQIKKTENNTEIILFNPAWHEYLQRNFNSQYFTSSITATYLRHYPLIEAELYHYFKDYQNYIYLPTEDIAIHHSVAQFVEATYRKKATKKTAYTKKRDTYIQIPPLAIPYFENNRLFQTDYKDKRRYLPWSEANSLFSSLLI